jgi:DNA-directed RNA polymerase specialized sigma subunit
VREIAVLTGVSASRVSQLTRNFHESGVPAA